MQPTLYFIEWILFRMANNSIIKSIGFPVERLVEAKGRGIMQSVLSTQLIDNPETVTSDKVSNIFVVPTGDMFTVIVKPSQPYKTKQTVIIMSKFVLKSLKSAYTATQETVPRNSFRTNEEFQRKWGR